MPIKRILVVLSLTNNIYAPFENTFFYAKDPVYRKINFQLLLKQGAEETVCVIYDEVTKKISFLGEKNNQKTYQLYSKFSYYAFTKFFSPDYNLLVVSNSEHIPLQKIITNADKRIRNS